MQREIEKESIDRHWAFPLLQYHGHLVVIIFIINEMISCVAERRFEQNSLPKEFEAQKFVWHSIPRDRRTTTTTMR